MESTLLRTRHEGQPAEGLFDLLGPACGPLYAAHRRRTSSRCQPSTVSGLTSKAAQAERGSRSRKSARIIRSPRSLLARSRITQPAPVWSTLHRPQAPSPVQCPWQHRRVRRLVRRERYRTGCGEWHQRASRSEQIPQRIPTVRYWAGWLRVPAGRGLVSTAVMSGRSSRVSP
jgi:hypothetical protein